MEPLELLKQISFGIQVAEDEVNELESYFVETDQWSRIASGEKDIIRGEKGAGKSAIYSLLIKKTNEFFDRGILLIAAENPRGGTVFKDLVADPPTAEPEFIALWKLYIITLIAQKMREYGIRNDAAEKVFRTLEDARLLDREFSLGGLLRAAQDYARKITKLEALEGGITIDPATQMPSGITGRIVLREPTAELREKGFHSADGLLAALNQCLTEWDYKVWVLLDRLDVAFADTHQLEANALRALVHVYRDMQAFDHLSMKVFLREDIWRRITEGMREASHLARFVILDWTPQALLNLVMRRLLSNEVLLTELKIDRASVLQDIKKQENLLERLFPHQVDLGAKKPVTFKWMLTRSADGSGKAAPRELIYLLNCIKDEEIKRLENGGAPTEGGRLFDRSVFKPALATVSDYRLKQFLYAEYAADRPYVAALEGEKSEQTIESLMKIWKMDLDTALKEAMGLVEIGFFEKRGTREEPTFWVPFLYRPALDLVQGLDDEG